MVIAPGSVLGVLGGGQLGSMFAAAAGRMGYRVAVWDPDSDAPAHRLAAYSVTTPFSDPQTILRFSDLVSVVTYEWENVPVSLCRELERRKPLRPSSAILGVIQDRLAQKTYLAEAGFPVARFAALTNPADLPHTIEQIGYPAVCKTATAGYDGKGQWRILRASDVGGVQSELRASARDGSWWIVESFVPFERELSILVARGADGGSAVYPVAENEHEGGILRTTIVPADVSEKVIRNARELAQAVVERLDGIGVFCLELFLLSGEELLINEVAPRPHNSGHYSLDACTVSQFEQQVRTVCGLPLGEVRLLSPVAMVNLIGEDAANVMNEEGCRALLSVPGAVLHLYGKQTIRPRRKMGHVTFLSRDASSAKMKAAQLRERLHGMRAT